MSGGGSAACAAAAHLPEKLPLLLLVALIELLLEVARVALAHRLHHLLPQLRQGFRPLVRRRRACLVRASVVVALHRPAGAAVVVANVVDALARRLQLLEDVDEGGAALLQLLPLELRRQLLDELELLLLLHPLLRQQRARVVEHLRHLLLGERRLLLALVLARDLLDLLRRVERRRALERERGRRASANCAEQNCAAEELRAAKNCARRAPTPTSTPRRR